MKYTVFSENLIVAPFIMCSQNTISWDFTAPVSHTAVRPFAGMSITGRSLFIFNSVLRPFHDYFVCLFVCLFGFNVAFNIICHITTVSGCDSELNAHFYSAASLWYQIPDTFI